MLSGWDIRVGLGAHCQTRAQGKGAPGRNDPLILLSLSRFLTVELALATPGLNSLSAIRARAISEINLQIKGDKQLVKDHTVWISTKQYSKLDLIISILTRMKRTAKSSKSP